MLDVDPALPTALIDFPAENGARRQLRFDRPVRWLVALDPAQVPGLLDAAHREAREGRWCVGWVAYEAAPGLDPHLPVKALPPGTPYAVWAVFDKASPWPSPPAEDDTPSWETGPWHSDLDEATAVRRIENIRALIREGEVYQVNLTARLSSGFSCAPPPTAGANGLLAYFDALHRSQPQAYAVYLDARAASRTPGALLSVSPELFFDWNGSAITTRPMKGTAPRGTTPQADEAARDGLRASAKERAENLMIVDLLRNDLSRIAEVGSVAVPALFEVQALPTVWQMTSTVTARTRPATTLSEVFAALFPCGSVTGAPKRQAMHHIARLEASPRGVYCGAAGLMAPGGRVTINVPIRTVVAHTPPPPAPWHLQCGIGSGITLDATPQGEAAEWRAKRAFLHRADQPFALLESLRLEHGQVARLEHHLDRLARAARHFGHRWDDEASALAVRQALRDQALAHPAGVHKLRLTWSASGRLHLACAPLTGPDGIAALPLLHTRAPSPVQLAPHPLRHVRHDEFLRYKTTQRRAYAPFAPPAGMLDTLLYDEDGALTEFTIGNVALKMGGRWYTPPCSAGLLPGVMRQSLLEAGLLAERPLSLADLNEAEQIALLNSVRQCVPVQLVVAPARRG